jgi:hypothetical protein
MTLRVFESCSMSRVKRLIFESTGIPRYSALHLALFRYSALA